jgi:hypothetical protein
MDKIVVPSEGHSPELCVRVNPLYSLYHYLRIQAAGPLPAIRPETAGATHIMRTALNYRTVAGVANMGGYHGLWDLWERPFTVGGTVEGISTGWHAELQSLADQVEIAMSMAEGAFLETIWPERLPMIQAALQTIEEKIVPHFAKVARRQADQLDLTWPDRVDVNLVTYCYDRFEAYATPLTIDVSRCEGFDLCENLLHEATHIADGHTNANGMLGLGDRLLLFLLQAEVPSFGAILDARHAIVFASSAHQIRTHIHSSHVDYAVQHGLYERLSTPALPSLWAEFTSGALSEKALFEAVAKQLNRPT